jgi:hypothetical protein
MRFFNSPNRYRQVRAIRRHHGDRLPPRQKKTDLAVHSNVDKDWITEEHNTTARDLGTKFGTSMQTGNVLVNPLPDGQWGGQPDIAAAPGLQLWVRHAVDKGRIPIAAVNVNQFLQRKKRGMHYGSFRAAIKFSGMNGTRGAFSWKSKDKSSGQYISMEFSSNQSRTISVLAKTENAVSTWNCTAAVKCPQDFHEYRFDWFPGRIDFFFDNIPAGTASESIPDSAGTLELVHGVDNGFANPPAQDAVMTVGYVKAYYNTTSRDQPPPGCRDLHENVCPIHDQDKAPNPDGNMTLLHLAIRRFRGGERRGDSDSREWQRLSSERIYDQRWSSFHHVRGARGLRSFVDSMQSWRALFALFSTCRVFYSLERMSLVFLLTIVGSFGGRL